MRLLERVAIVTGAGSGIGETIALRFAEEGMALVLNDVSAENLGGIAQKVRDMGRKAEGVAGDISDPGTGKFLTAKAVEKFRQRAGEPLMVDGGYVQW